MKKTFYHLCITALFLIVSGFASAETVSFNPDAQNLWDLDHYKLYTWDIDWSLSDDQVLTDVSLSFNQIYDNTFGANSLWVNLLDEGDYYGYEWHTGNAYRWNDPIDGRVDTVGLYSGFGWYESHYLFSWEDTSHSAQNLTYHFTEAQMAALTTLSADGSFGLAFDPDCHFVNQGISLTITTTSKMDPVPEPATMLLVGLGLLGAAGMARRKIS